MKHSHQPLIASILDLNKSVKEVLWVIARLQPQQHIEFLKDLFENHQEAFKILNQHLTTVQFYKTYYQEFEQKEKSSLFNIAFLVSSSLVPYMLQWGMDVDVHEDGQTLLMRVVQTPNQDELVQLLLQKGANPNFPNLCQETPLMMAADEYKEYISLLLQYGGDLKQKDQSQRDTLMHYVSSGRHNTLIPEILTHNKSNLDLQDQDGCTPLMMACSFTPELVIPLIEAGANLHLQDKFGDTAFFYATKGFQNEMKAYFDLKIISFFLTQGININTKGCLGATVLNSDFPLYNQTLISFLLQQGADIDSQDDNGITLLMKTVYQPKIFSYLVHSGANLFLKDVNGQDVFWHAAKAPEALSLLKSTIEHQQLSIELQKKVFNSSPNKEQL